MKFSLASVPIASTGPSQPTPDLLGLIETSSTALEDGETGFASLLNCEMAGEQGKDAIALTQPQNSRRVATGKPSPACHLTESNAADVTPAADQPEDEISDVEGDDSSHRRTVAIPLAASPATAVLGALQMVAQILPDVAVADPSATDNGESAETAQESNAAGSSSDVSGNSQVARGETSTQRGYAPKPADGRATSAIGEAPEHQEQAEASRGCPPVPAANLDSATDTPLEGQVSRPQVPVRGRSPESAEVTAQAHASAPDSETEANQPDGNVRIPTNSRSLGAETTRFISTATPDKLQNASEPGQSRAEPATPEDTQIYVSQESGSGTSADPRATTRFPRDTVRNQEGRGTDSSLETGDESPVARHDSPAVFASSPPHRTLTPARELRGTGRSQIDTGFPRSAAESAALENPVREVATSESLKAELSGRAFSASVVSAAHSRKAASGPEHSLPEQSRSVRWMESEARPLHTLMPVSAGNLGKSWLADLRTTGSSAEAQTPIAGENDLVESEAASAESSADPTVPAAKPAPGSATREKGLRTQPDSTTESLEGTPKPPLTISSPRKDSLATTAAPTQPGLDAQDHVEPSDPQTLATTGEPDETGVRTQPTSGSRRPARSRPVGDAREALRADDARTTRRPLAGAESSPLAISAAKASTIPVLDNLGFDSSGGMNDSEDQGAWRSMLSRATAQMKRGDAVTESVTSARDLQNQLSSRGRAMPEDGRTNPDANSSAQAQLASPAGDNTQEGTASKAGTSRSATPQPNLPETVRELPARAARSEESAGITTAQSVQRMIKPEKTGKSGVSAEQKLPGTENPAVNPLSAVSASETLGNEGIIAKRAARHSPDDLSGTGTPASSAARPARQDDMLLPREEVQVRRMLTAETSDMISDHALRLRQTGGDQLSVVVQPDPRTRIRLELSFDGSVVEARAALEHGDFGLLSACWPELQNRLLEQGVRIAPLAAAPSSVSAWTGGESPSRREQSSPRNPTPEDTRPVVNITEDSRKRQAVRASRGNRFDLWA